jgi:predicted phosphodiesterase
MAMKIAVITDTHLAAIAPDFIANCAAAIAWINMSGVELVIHLGDITADGIEAPGQFDTARTVLAALKAPLLCVPGNHDIGDNPVPGLAAGEKPFDPAMLARFHAAFGPDRWAHDAAGWKLIGLNAMIFGTATNAEAAQAAWLAGVLDGHDGPIGLFLHKPWYREALEDSERHGRYVPLETRRALAALFTGRDLRFIASGHTHQLREHHADGIDHVWVASTAFIIPDTMQEAIGTKRVGFSLLTLEEDGHRFDYVEAPGMHRFDLADYAAVFPKVRAALDRVPA